MITFLKFSKTILSCKALQYKIFFCLILLLTELSWLKNGLRRNRFDAIRGLLSNVQRLQFHYQMFSVQFRSNETKVDIHFPTELLIGGCRQLPLLLSSTVCIIILSVCLSLHLFVQAVITRDSLSFVRLYYYSVCLFICLFRLSLLLFQSSTLFE